MPSPRRKTPSKAREDNAKSPGSVSGRSSRGASRTGSDDIMQPPTPSTPGRSGSVRSTPRRGRSRDAATTNGTNGNIIPDSDGMSMPPTPGGRNIAAPSPFTGGEYRNKFCHH